MKKEVYLLIDSHALIHRAYHALPYLQTKDGRPSGALYGLITILLGAIERFKPDYIYAANDLPKTTFREMAFNGYKAHRTKTEDFLVEQIIAMPELFNSFGIPLLSLEGYEADDVIGTLVTKIQNAGGDYKIIILTGDMDIMQLIDDDKVVVYTAKKGEEEIIYHEQEVMKKYGLLPKQIPDYKGLRGDTSDNIPGIKGIGEKTALTILQKGGTLENVYEQIKSGKDKDYFGITERMFELLKNGEEDAEFSRELATINCDIEIDIPTDGKFILQEKINNLKNYCEDFGFASIKKRLEKLEGLAKNRDEKGDVILNDFAVVGEVVKQEQSINHTFNTTEFKKIQILFWLLNSQETNIDQDRVNYLISKYKLEEGQALPAGEGWVGVLEKEITKKDLDFVYKEIELPLIPILEEANVAGIKVDREKLKTLLQTYEKNRAELEEKIYGLAGKTFNLNSPKQLGIILFEELKVQDVGATKIKKTAGGKLSTRAEVLEEMKDNHPIISLLLDFREKEKMINTYLEPLLVYSQFDEKIHTTFIQTGAQTGRFSSLNPNMQNIPVKGEEGVELRKCFIADEGKVLVAADYSQIELRIAAMLSGEEYLKEIFEKDEDIHTSVAKKMFKKEEVTKEERNAAKAMNFGILYGMGVNSIKNTLKVERNVAQAFYDSYTLVMPALMKYLKDTISKAKDLGYTETLYGRQRNIPELFSNIPMIRASGERFAMNAPIQGTNADIIKLAITDFKKVCIAREWTDVYDKKTREKISPKVTFLLQIHDELIYEVNEEMVDEVSKELKKVMESVLENHKPKNTFLPVPIKVNVKSGYNWGEM